MRAPRKAFLSTSLCEYKRMGELRESSQKYQHRISYHARTGALRFRALRRIEQLMSVEGSAALPLWLLYEEEIEGWKSAQAAHIVAWLGEHQFKAERHRVLLVPDSQGAAVLAITGLGKRHGELSLWHVAGLPERLPTPRKSVSGSNTERIATSAIGAPSPSASRRSSRRRMRIARTMRSPARRSP